MKTQDSIRALLVWDLRARVRELEGYDDPAQIWELPPGISNPAGSLALHVVGNLQAFVGAALGDSARLRGDALLD
jgi:hypothetical protein